MAEEMVFLVVFVLSFFPAWIYARVLYWLDRYEKEPKKLIAVVFGWGAVVATIGAMIASQVLQAGVLVFTGSMDLVDFTGATVIAPLTEETLKGFAVLIIFLRVPREFDTLMDGIVYAGIAALGFAATENLLYLLVAYVEAGMDGLMGLFVLRVLLGGWNHPVYTAFIGIGFAITRMHTNRFIKIAAPLVGWVVAMVVHGVHNVLALTVGEGALFTVLLVDWLGWLGLFGMIVWSVSRERHWIRHYLAEEVDHVVITPEQFAMACSWRPLRRTHLRKLSDEDDHAARRFYHLCAELAQKKHQLARVGDEGRNRRLIEELRAELSALSPEITNA